MATKALPTKTQYSVTDARAALPDILDQVEAGAMIQITRRGVVVASVISLEEWDRIQKEKRANSSNWLAEWRAKNPEGIEGVTDEWVASLRDKSPGRDFEFEVEVNAEKQIDD